VAQTCFRAAACLIAAPATYLSCAASGLDSPRPAVVGVPVARVEGARYPKACVSELCTAAFGGSIFLVSVASKYDRVVAVLRVPGGELYYEAEGDGVAVVLVHGLALDARMWDDQVPALKDIARVVRYDVRGFGRSRRDADTSYSHADDLWRLLDHLEIDKTVLVGLSMGGRIVVEATLAAPERVRALVLLDAVLDGVPWDPDSERGIQAIGEGLRSGGLDEAKAAWLRHDFFVPAQRTPDVARRLAEMVGDYSGVNWTSADPHAPHPQIPGGQDLPLVHLTGRFVKATETPFTVGPALICGGPGGREGDLQDLRATSVAARLCALRGGVCA
jgi:3-oxoadipate enol-lactonase